MRLLVLGGTRFLGRGVVEAALDRGHEVTLFNRGQTNPKLFPSTERIRGDLTGNLDQLESLNWNAVIDLDPTQLPRQTRRRCEALRVSVEHYVFVSTISVYSDTSQPTDEDAPLLEPPDPEPDEFDINLYGNLKVGSEQAVRDVFEGRAAIARAGLIVGPHDPTDRFTYWPRRLAEGGEILAPGDPEQPLQLIDARDLGGFLVSLAESKTVGIFNATGPAEPLTLGKTLERLGGGKLVWVDEQKVLAAGVQPWMELPLWVPREFDGFLRADISRALAAGIMFRPLEETARDTLVWSLEAGEQRPTLSREKEREILASA